MKKNLFEDVEGNFQNIGIGGSMVTDKPYIKPLDDILDKEDSKDTEICEKCGKKK